MCVTNVVDYQRCKCPAHSRHQKSDVKRCLLARLGFYANTYHPIRVVNAIVTESGYPVAPVVDETCPTCYPEEAAAEQKRREQEAGERAAEEKRAVDEEIAEYTDIYEQNRYK